MAYAVLGHQVADGGGADGAGAAGHQDRALGIEHRCPRGLPGTGAGEAGQQDPAVAEGDVGLVVAQGPGDGPRVGPGGVGVHEQEAAGVLRLAERTSPRTAAAGRSPASRRRPRRRRRR